MQKQRTCPNCGTKYWTRLIKVWIFKRRFCPKCDKPMFSYNDRRIHKCRKCGFKIEFDSRKVAEMKVEMRGASRDSAVARGKRKIGLEVEKKLVPKNRICQHCRNLRSKVEGIMKRKTAMSRGQIRELSDEELMRIFHEHVQKIIKKEQRAEAQRRKEKEYVEQVQRKLKEKSKEIKCKEKKK